MTQTAVVTGASGGIGSAVVRALQARSFDVYAVSRTSGPGIPVPPDLASEFELPAQLAGLSRLDALVHCAGIAPLATVSDADPSVWRSVLADSLRAEERSLRVTTVYPAGTATPLLEQVRAGFGRPYDPATAIQPSTLASYVALAIDAPADAYLSELTVLPVP